MEEKSCDACDGRGMDGAGEMTLFGFVGAAGIAEQDEEESEAAEAADDAKLGEKFDVVVVNVIDEVAVVVGFEFWIDRDESAEARAADGISAEQVQAAFVHGETSGDGNFAGAQDGKALDDLAGAEPRDKSQSRQDDDADSDRGFAAAGLAGAGEKAEDGEFENETDDAGARAGEDQAADGDDAEESGERKNVATHAAENHESERKRKSEFDEAGVVVAVHIGAEDGAADGELAKPIDRIFRGEVLRDAEERDGEAKHGEKPGEASEIASAAKGLCGEKKQNCVGSEKKQIDACEVGILAAVQEELRAANGHESEERIEQWVERDFDFAVAEDRERPNQKKNRGENLDGGDGPDFDGAKREDGEGEDEEQAVANDVHFAGGSASSSAGSK